MKNKNILSFLVFALIFVIFSCKKEATKSDLDTLRNFNNKKYYPATKMDSLQAINTITKQKVQELIDLSTLYASGNKDTEIDSVIYAQMQSYFEKPDSLKLKSFLKQLDTLDVKTAKVNELTVNKIIKGKDTIDHVDFMVQYFDRQNKNLGVYNKNAAFILKLNPVKFKKEFKFYFLDFDQISPKDSTSVGVTK